MRKVEIKINQAICKRKKKKVNCLKIIAWKIQLVITYLKKINKH